MSQIPPIQPSLQDVTTYLIDLDGVVYRGESVINGAREFIDWLDAQHKKYLYLTNNSFASELQVVEKLARVGISTDLSHVMGAAQAAVQSIAQRFPGGSVYVIGEAPLFDIVRSHGLKISNEDWQGTDVVFVGLDRSFNYKKLTEAVLAIRKGADFIAINRDPLLPIAGGALTAGCGTMVAAIEAGSETSPKVIGKPEPALLQEAMRKLNSQPSETVMVGDNIGIDIKAGAAAGTQTLLVFSGKDTPASLAASTLKPDYVYEDLAAVLHALKS
ncbi:HAD-IIA family hydrolase [Dictyobacter arantiisoli]|uniref:Acid sugar phosphatase n=1 Tax=Dictyobacter arantiisoli TaxID=2014874 RepID=A0A5A5T9T9_9CHLR|nr:HAD-IIA family hydrolase [Dictyobacter arantiisoli]GCF08280.1 acid sugar phosphatase [Dictyobacter arantiisoli]